MKVMSTLRCDFGKFVLIMSVVAITSIVFQGGNASGESETIKIGTIGAVTGVGYLQTKQCFDGVNLAVGEINGKGGILGRQIETIVRDDELKVDVGVREMKDLILRKKVDFVVGGCSSAVTLAQSDVAKKYKVPYLVAMANSQRLSEDGGHRYVFVLPPNTRMEATALAISTSKKGWKKVWALAPDYEWGHTFTEIYLKKLKALVPDVEVLGESWPKLGETDFTPYITSVIAAKPDFLFSILWGGDLINFTKQAKPYGLFEKMVASGLYDFNQLGAIGSEMVEGVLGFSRGDFFCVKSPEMDSFVKKFRAAYDEQYPSVFATQGYDAIYCLKKAIEQVGAVDREKVVDALEGMQFDSPRGKLYFRKYDHQVNAAVFTGFTTKSPDYPFYVYSDITRVPGDEAWLSVEEIKKLRHE